MLKHTDPNAYAAVMEGVISAQEKEMSTLRSALAEVTAALEATRRERDLDQERVAASVGREMACVIRLAETERAAAGWRQMAEASLLAGNA